MRLSRGNMRKNTCLLVGILVAIAGCKSPEEEAKSHLEKGKTLFDQGEYAKAILELKSSAQSDNKQAETYYYMALLDEKNNNFKSMKQNLLRALELDGNLMDARRKLGKIHLLFGELDDSLKQVELIMSANPDDAEGKLLKASVFMRQNKNAEAEAIVDQVLANVPDNIDGLSLKAAFAFQKNDLVNALNLIEKGLQKDNKNLPLRLFRVKIHSKQDDVASVTKDYQELVALYPDADNFKLSLASIYSMTDKLSDAETLLRGMVESKPDVAEPKIVLLEFLNAKAKDKVVPELDKILSATDFDLKQLLELSKWMLASGYADQAQKGLESIAKRDSDSDVGLNAKTILAELVLAKKDFDSVEKSISEILSKKPDFLDANLLKARLLMSQQKIDEAIEFLNKLSWSNNKSDNAFALLGQAYALKKDQKSADKNFKQALELNPANIGALMPVYTNYLQANQKDSARQYLEKALQSNPNQVLLLTTKADLDIAEKRWDDAQDVVRRIALFSKNRLVPTYLQANIYQGKGQFNDAIKLYESVLSERPDHINALVNLAKCYEGLNARDKSILFFESLHQRHPDSLAVVGILADLYVANKDLVKAKTLLNQQIENDKDKSAPLYLALAKVEASIRKTVDAAKDVYIKGLTIHPNDAQLSMALAGAYEQTGDIAGARGVYEKLLEVNPDFSLAANNLASLLLDYGKEADIPAALKLAERFKNSESVYFLDTYAWSLVKSGNNSEGLKILESLLLKEPKMPELRYHLGVAYLNNGNKATAASELKQSLALSEKQQRNFVGKEKAKQLVTELAGK